MFPACPALVKHNQRISDRWSKEQFKPLYIWDGCNQPGHDHYFRIPWLPYSAPPSVVFKRILIQLPYSSFLDHPSYKKLQKLTPPTSSLDLQIVPCFTRSHEKYFCKILIPCSSILLPTRKLYNFPPTYSSDIFFHLQQGYLFQWLIAHSSIVLPTRNTRTYSSPTFLRLLLLICNTFLGSLDRYHIWFCTPIMCVIELQISLLLEIRRTHNQP